MYVILQENNKLYYFKINLNIGLKNTLEASGAPWTLSRKGDPGTWS